MAKSEKDYTFPKMFYNKKTSDYIIVQNMDEVPKGYVTNPADCVNRRGVLRPDSAVQVLITNPTITPPAKKEEVSVNDFGKKSKKPAAAKAAAAPKAKEKVVEKATEVEPAEVSTTLKSLKLSRDEAVEMLTQEKIKFDPEASDDAIAAIIGELLDEDEADGQPNDEADDGDDDDDPSE